MHISLPVMVVRLRRAQHKDHGGQGIILLRVTRSAKQWPWQSTPWQPSGVTTKAIKWTGLPGSSQDSTCLPPAFSGKGHSWTFSLAVQNKIWFMFCLELRWKQVEFFILKENKCFFMVYFCSNPVDCINECHVWSKKKSLIRLFLSR